MNQNQQYQQATSLGQVSVTDNTANSLAMYASSGTTLTNAVGGGWQYYDGTLNNAIEDYRIHSTPLTPKKEKKMAIDKNKRGLFQVILIDPKEKKMLLDKIVIADNIEDVLLEVDAGVVIKNAGLLVSDVDKIVNIIGQVRKTRKNKNGEVEIITEEVKD